MAIEQVSEIRERVLCLTERQELQAMANYALNPNLRDALNRGIGVLYATAEEEWPMPAIADRGKVGLNIIAGEVLGPVSINSINGIAGLIQKEDNAFIRKKGVPAFGKKQLLLALALMHTLESMSRDRQLNSYDLIVVKTAVRLQPDNPLLDNLKNMPEGDFEKLKPRSHEAYLEEIMGLKSPDDSSLRDKLLAVEPLIPDEPLSTGELASFITQVQYQGQDHNGTRKKWRDYIDNTLLQSLNIHLGVKIYVGENHTCLFGKDDILAVVLFAGKRGLKKPGTNMNLPFVDFAKAYIEETHPWYSRYIVSRNDPEKKSIKKKQMENLEEIKDLNIEDLKNLQEKLYELALSDPETRVNMEKLQDLDIGLSQQKLAAALEILMDLAEMVKNKPAVDMTNKSLLDMVDDVITKCEYWKLEKQCLYRVFIGTEKLLALNN